MLTISEESTIFVDVDDTLVMWGQKPKTGQKRVKIVDPYSGEALFLTPHLGHIKVLKDRKARGSYVVVWSAGGNRWADAVVRALKLDSYVDLVMTKPHIYIDDKKASEFMQEHLYIPYGNGYGE